MRGVLAALAVAFVGCADLDEPSVAACASCHTVTAQRFARSAHAGAAESELFRALRAREGAQRQAFCDRCHAPSAHPSGGLSCATCHHATGNRETANGRLTWDFSRAPMGRSGEAPHGLRDPGFLRDAQLCGSCHEVEGGPGFDEPAFSEFVRSPAARAGLGCADCHADRDHGFVGREHPEAAARFAQSASVRVQFLDAETLEVTLTNESQAHALPSGFRLAREVSVVVDLYDAAGRLRETLRDDAPGDDAMTLGERVEDARGARVLPAEGVRVRRAVLDPGASRRWRRRVTDPAVMRADARVEHLRQNAWLRAALGLAPLTEAPLVLAVHSAARPP